MGEVNGLSGILPQSLPRARVERVANAIFCPPREVDMLGLRQACGIFRPDRTPVEFAQTLSSDGILSPSVVPPVDRPVVRREGAWMYGGILFHHFGHALIYSAARLWAVRPLLDRGIPLRGVVFHQRFSAEPQASPALPRNAVPIFEVFRPDVPIETSGTVEEIEELYVPVQGLSTEPGLFIGLPEQRRFMRDCAARIAPDAAPRDIYVSRTRTGWKGNHLFETEIERAMAAAGYQVFHPQLHSLAEQIATYRSARRLVAVDGSALHVAAMALPADALVAVISRRAFFAWAIADQIRAFSGCRVRVIAAHDKVYAFSRGLGRRASWSGTQVTTDFARLGAELVAHGFLDRVPDWRLPTDTDLAARLAQAARKMGDDLVPVPDHLRHREPYSNLVPLRD